MYSSILAVVQSCTKSTYCPWYEIDRGKFEGRELEGVGGWRGGGGGMIIWLANDHPSVFLVYRASGRMDRSTRNPTVQEEIGPYWSFILQSRTG